MVHPDKSDHPKAQECFQKVNKINEILSDAEKRKFYDQYGTEEEIRAQYHNRHHGFPDDFDVNDIFMSAFRMHFGNAQFAHRRQQEEFVPRGPIGFSAYVLQLLPLIFILLTTILPYLTHTVYF